MAVAVPGRLFQKRIEEHPQLPGGNQMAANRKFGPWRAIVPAAALAGAFLGCQAPAQAHVASIVIDSEAPAYGGAAIGSAGSYVTVNGRVFGELDPKDAHNTIIQDIGLAPVDSTGMVPYIATFQIVMPASSSD